MIPKETLLKIKKGTKLIVNNGLGRCRAISLESARQGRGFKQTLLVDLKASELGFFDEMGSIYINEVLEIIEQKGQIVITKNKKEYVIFNISGLAWIVNKENKNLIDRILKKKGAKNET